MPMLGGHAVARALAEARCERIFTLCGGHVAPIYDGCVEAGIEVIDTRHEQGAAHAADAHARLTRGLGVAVLTAGPGVPDGITGIANAAVAGAPLLVLAGAPALKVMGRGALQEMDQPSLVSGITKARFTVVDPARIGETVARAIQTAQAGVPGPVFVELPFDVLSAECEATRLEPARFRPLPLAADGEAIEKLARLVRERERPILFAGSSVWWDDAGAEVERLAKLGLPVLANGMARGVLPPGHGSLIALARSQAFRRCDLLILVGAPLDFRLGYGKEIAAGALLAQIDRDPRNFGKNRAAEVTLQADARSSLRALADALSGHRVADGWLRELQTTERDKREQQLGWERDDRGPVNHFRLARAIADAAGADAIVIGDGGDVVSIAAKVIQPHAMGRWLDPGPFGMLGVGPPFALAAKKLRPSTQVILLSGDGSFGLNGFELETCVRFGLPVTVVVGNDAAWGQIRVPQIAAFGEARAVGSKLLPTRYDRIVAGFGGAGEHVESGGELDAALRRARDSGQVYCIDVALDPGFIARNSLSRFTVK
jgi:acetolactate synthase-1/2/3 large subunit